MPILEPEHGYDRYALHYKNDYGHLDSFDWNFCQERIWDMLEHKPAALLLDAGCGDGRILTRIARRFASADLWGWDISSKMIDCARKRTKGCAQLYKHDVTEKAPVGIYPEEGFDIVCAFFLLVHIPEPALMFRTIGGVLKKNGILMCNTIPQRRALKLNDGNGEFLIKYYDHDFGKVKTRLNETGFNIIEETPLEHSLVIIARYEGLK